MEIRARLQCEENPIISQIIETLFLLISNEKKKDEINQTREKGRGKVGKLKSAVCFHVDDISSTGGCYLSWIRFCLLTRLCDVDECQLSERASHTELLRRTFSSLFFRLSFIQLPRRLPTHPTTTPLNKPTPHYPSYMENQQKCDLRILIIITLRYQKKILVFFHHHSIFILSREKSQKFLCDFTCWKSNWFLHFCVSSIFANYSIT